MANGIIYQMLTVNCLKCNKEFKTYPSRVKYGKAQYCSFDCRKTTISKVCPICKIEYQTPEWLASIKKTCSKKCGQELTKKEQTPQHKCAKCGINPVKHRNRKYCCRKCYWDSSAQMKTNHCIDCSVKITPLSQVLRCTTCSGKSKAGNKHPMWIPDRTKLAKKQERNDSAYKEWRKMVWERDNFKCRMAGSDCLGKIEAHHIQSWKEYEELRYRINNGITLCHAHHPRKRAEEKRLAPIFTELVSVSK